MKTEVLSSAILQNQNEFGLNLSENQISRLAEYYQLLVAQNDLLHLVAPSSAEVFATRHILESLTLLEFLPENASFADVGTGGGLPSIPCLLMREDLRGFLIETSQKKSAFLRQTLIKLGLDKRSEVINARFEDAPKPEISFVTCRALDKFTKKLASLVKWAEKSDLLLFGGNSLRESLSQLKLEFTENLTPQSAQRLLFHVRQK